MISFTAGILCGVIGSMIGLACTLELRRDIIAWQKKNHYKMPWAISVFAYLGYALWTGFAKYHVSAEKEK